MMPDAQFATYPSLRDRAVLVTGGASGIGESLVRHFAHQGARVAFLDVRDEPAVALGNELAVAGCIAPFYLKCDLTDPDALRESVHRVLAAMGTIDVLVNNAGNDQRHRTEDPTPAVWDDCLRQNLKHYFFCTQAVLPSMKAAGSGSIINMSSIC